MSEDENEEGGQKERKIIDLNEERRRRSNFVSEVTPRKLDTLPITGEAEPSLSDQAKIKIVRDKITAVDPDPTRPVPVLTFEKELVLYLQLLDQIRDAENNPDLHSQLEGYTAEARQYEMTLLKHPALMEELRKLQAGRSDFDQSLARRRSAKGVIDRQFEKLSDEQIFDLKRRAEKLLAESIEKQEALQQPKQKSKIWNFLIRLKRLFRL